MLRKPFLILSLLTAGISLFAQNFGTVKGVVRDSTNKGVELISVVVDEDQKYNTTTDKNGAFELKVPANQKLTLVFSSLNTLPAKRSIEVKTNEIVTVNQFVSQKSNTLGGVEIKEKHQPIDISVVNGTVQSMNPSVRGDVTDMLGSQVLGFHKTNELSSSYSVRGGSFDENLVYVNDFEIYRPYLVRSAQQEGLSFPNPDMIGGIKFSSGGFQARYGDKMSSVMDVTYRTPDSIRGSFYASLLGLGGHLEGGSKKFADGNRRFTFNIGVRQQLSQYILGSQDTKGEYNPNYLDLQGFFTLRLTEKWSMEALTNFSRNQFNFKPVNRQTTFGLLTDVKQLEVYYDGQEADQYITSTNGLSVIFDPNPDLHIKFLGSYALDREKENYDINGQYYLSEVNSDLGSKNFGQTLYSLGTGGLQNWARNTLNIDVYTAATRGSWFKSGHNLQWGADYKREVVADKISEWTRLDSAGYSTPYNFTTANQLDSNGNLISDKETVDMNRLLKSSFALKSNRFSGYIQDSYKWGKESKFTINYGLRFTYWDVNKELLPPTPRVQFSWKPKGKNDIVFTASTGLYYQPPFYREMRNDFTGVVNTSLKAQKSFHAVAGFNYSFKAWHRNFNFTSEIYYKYMWDLVPYAYSDVDLQYLGTNSAVGYAYGIDMRLNGELVEGAESWISMSILKTAQKIAGEQYTVYYDSAHTQIAYTPDNIPSITDSAHVKPGFTPRPTDQRVSFNMFFQDYIPKFKFIKIHINLVFATGLPFGPPGDNFYQNTLRMPPYRRVDIGFSGQLWNPNWAKKRNAFNQGLKGVWLSLEVFNIFGITNTISYLWISDVSGSQYAVPNYLTSRRINAKLIVNF